MPIASKLLGVGVPAPTAREICGTTKRDIIASGTTQATATQLSDAYNVIEVVPVGTGVRLFPCEEGANPWVVNLGSNPVIVYPFGSNTINGQASYSVSANSNIQFAGLQDGDWQPLTTALPDNVYIPVSQKGQPGGVASLDGDALVPPTQLREVSTTQAGIMTSADKIKLDGIEDEATKNQTDAYLLNRANHTGTQTMATISNAGVLATKNTVNNGDWSGAALAVGNGGTGATTAAAARTNLGLGSLATANNVNNANWSGTPLSVANGGTGSMDAAAARTALGLGSMAQVNSPAPVANGGTGATSAATARTNLGIGNIATRAITISTSDPSGGVDGDIWLKV